MVSFHSIIAPKPAHLMSIGAVSAHWNLLDSAIALLIWEIAPLKQLRAQAVTTHLNEKMRMDILKSLAHEIFPDHPLEIELISQINYIANTLKPKRDKIVHGVWAPCSDPAKIGL